MLGLKLIHVGKKGLLEGWINIDSLWLMLGITHALTNTPVNTLMPRQDGCHFSPISPNTFIWMKLFEFWLQVPCDNVANILYSRLDCSPHKGSEVRKALPWHVFIMIFPTTYVHFPRHWGSSYNWLNICQHISRAIILGEISWHKVIEMRLTTIRF